MAAGVGSEDHVAFSRNERGWWVPSEGSLQATVLPENVAMTHRDVLEIAKLNWTVEKVPAYDFYNGQYRTVTRKVIDRSGREKEQVVSFNNRRTDTGLIVGTGIGTRYEVYQNEDATAWLDLIVDGGNYTYDTAGSLFNCSRVWLLMDAPEDIILGGDENERIRPQLLFTNTHDGSGAVTLAVVLTRVVCANTLAWALQDAPRVYKVRHTATMDQRLQDARSALGIAFKYQEQFQVTAERLIDMEIGEDGILKMLDSLVPLVDTKGEEKTGRAHTTAVDMRGKILGLHYGADNLKHLPETSAYRFVQAVEEYSDHYAIFRNTDGENAAENRFAKLADGRTLGNKAFELAKALLPA